MMKRKKKKIRENEGELCIASKRQVPIARLDANLCTLDAGSQELFCTNRDQLEVRSRPSSLTVNIFRACLPVCLSVYLSL